MGMLNFISLSYQMLTLWLRDHKFKKANIMVNNDSAFNYRFSL